MRDLSCVAMSQEQGKCCCLTIDSNKGVAVLQLPAEVPLTKPVHLATTGLLYNNNIYLLQLGCHPVAVVILHVNKT